jgi:hypothetical protein
MLGYNYDNWLHNDPRERMDEELRREDEKWENGANWADLEYSEPKEENPFLAMGEEQFLKFLERNNVKISGTNMGIGSIVFENDD